MNGLRNNLTELKFVIRARKPDVVFLNEIHLTENCDTSDLKIRNYNFEYCLSHSKHTGGVCAYINNQIKYENVSLRQENIAWYLSLEIIINKKSTVLAGVYLSSNNEHKQMIMDSFENWFDSISTDKNIVVCGDFNIDLLSHTTHSQRLTNFCTDNGLFQLVNSPTRITAESKTIIDLCLTNIANNIIECKVIEDDKISDHEMLEIIICGQRELKIVKSRQVRIFENYNPIHLYNEIENYMYSWRLVENCDLEVKTDWLLLVLKNATSQFIKYKTFKTSHEFFDSELEQMRTEKNRLYKIAQLSYGTPNST